MGLGVHLGEDVGNHAVLVHHKGGADDAHVGLAAHLLLAPSTKGLDGGGLHVGQQVEGQAELVPELGVRGLAILADSQHHCSLGQDVVIHITESAGLRGTARGIVLRIEINHDFLSSELGRRNHGSLLIGKAEFRHFISNLQHKSSKKLNSCL